MATTTLQPGSAPANAPARHLSRRGIIGILATGPIAMLPPIAASKLGSAEAAGITPSFADLLAKLAAAREASEEYRVEVFNPAEKLFKEEGQKIPHVTVDYMSNGGPAVWSTERPSDVSMCRALARPFRKGEEPFRKDCRLIVNADRKRRHKIKQLRLEHDIDAINARYDALSEAWADAVVTVVKHPVSNLAELNAKFTVMEDEDWFVMDEGKEAIIADVRRLAGGA